MGRYEAVSDVHFHVLFTSNPLSSPAPPAVNNNNMHSVKLIFALSLSVCAFWCLFGSLDLLSEKTTLNCQLGFFHAIFMPAMC